jgi:flagellar M-ring protein FliF
MAYEQRIGLARRMVAENPKQVAQVVKNWVGEDGG